MSKQVKITLNEVDEEMINKASKEANVTMNAFVKISALMMAGDRSDEVVALALKEVAGAQAEREERLKKVNEIERFRGELSRVGNNLNQVSRKINKGRVVNGDDLVTPLYDLKLTLKRIEKKLDEV